MFIPPFDINFIMDPLGGPLLCSEPSNIKVMFIMLGYEDTTNLTQRAKHMRNSSFYSLDGYLSELDKEIGSITSRDQIIDPYSLVDINAYKRTAGGKALYNADLQRAIAYAEKQEAAYQEWYESPEQIALRERQAGRNPDLIDGALGSGEAADTQPSVTSPMEGIPTIGEQVATGFQTTMSIVSTIGNLMSLPSQILNIGAATKLTGAQANLVNMQGLKEFESLVYGDVSDKLATAIQTAVDAGNTAFNIADFFKGDFEEVFTAYAPQDTPQYRAAFKRALGNVQKIQGDAYSAGATTESNKSTYAKLKAHPYADSNVVSMVGMMEPVEQARQQLDVIGLEMQTLFNYIKMRYAENLNPEELASYFMESEEYKALHTKSLATIDSARAQIQANLLDQYMSYKDSLWKQMDAMNCMSLLLGHAPLSWQQELTNYMGVILERLFPASGQSGVQHPSFPSVSPSSGSHEAFMSDSLRTSILGQPTVPSAFRSGMDYHEGSRYYDVYRNGHRIKLGD